MRIPAFVIGVVALAGSALSLPATTNAASTVAGYLNPVNGTFTPAATQAQLAATAAAALTRTGIITVIMTIQFGADIPAAQQLTCSISIGSSDFPGISNSASASAGVIRTGKTGKCTMVIPYNWTVASAKTMMSVNFASVSTGQFGSGDVTSRSASTSFTAFAVPNGKKTLSVTLAL